MGEGGIRIANGIVPHCGTDVKSCLHHGVACVVMFFLLFYFIKDSLISRLKVRSGAGSITN